MVEQGVRIASHLDQSIKGFVGGELDGLTARALQANVKVARSNVDSARKFLKTLGDDVSLPPELQQLSKLAESLDETANFCKVCLPKIQTLSVDSVTASARKLMAVVPTLPTHLLKHILNRLLDNCDWPACANIIAGSSEFNVGMLPVVDQPMYAEKRLVKAIFPQTLPHPTGSNWKGTG